LQRPRDAAHAVAAGHVIDTECGHGVLRVEVLVPSLSTLPRRQCQAPSVNDHDSYSANSKAPLTLPSWKG
jgi:hypothetical protein